MKNIRVFNTTEELAEILSAEILQKISLAAVRNNPFNLMLSGGKTPELLYKTIQKITPEGFSWKHVNFYWGDERCVHHTDPESNFGQASKLWLDTLQISDEQMNPLYSGHPLEEELKRNEIMLAHAGIFDLVFLGIGDDGHFASVFPVRPELFESQKLCEATLHPVTCQQRITVTPKLLKTRTKSIVFIVTGSNKAGIINKIFNESPDHSEYIPAARLRKTCDNLYWYLDKDAAGSLSVTAAG
jgi:6-phosphogluconolactonase